MIKVLFWAPEESKIKTPLEIPYPLNDFTQQLLKPVLRFNQILILLLLLLLAVLLVITALLLLSSLLIVIPCVLVSATSLSLPTPLVEFIQHLLRYPVQQLLWIDAQQAPGHINGLEDAARLVGRLRDEGAFELLEELEGQLVFRGEGLFPHDGFHASSVPTNGVLGVELIGDVAVVFARVALADGGFHESGQGGEHVDGWVDAFIVQLAVDEDLALGDVTCQIGDGVCDI